MFFKKTAAFDKRFREISNFFKQRLGRLIMEMVINLNESNCNYIRLISKLAMPSQRKTNIYTIYDRRRCLRIYICIQTVLQTKNNLVSYVKYSEDQDNSTARPRQEFLTNLP